MPRETKEQRAARQEQEQLAEQARLAEYRASVPARLMAASALAVSVGVSANVSLTPTGPAVHFQSDWSGDAAGFDETITYETDEWELEYVERHLRTLKEEQDARAERRAVAQEVFDNLTPEQRAAVKENISWLRG